MGVSVTRPPSRPTTPSSHNPFDVIQRAPSITMEKIKNQTSATLDRMSILQQRYRQHQELQRNGVPDPMRRLSSASQMDLDSLVRSGITLAFFINHSKLYLYNSNTIVQRPCVQPVPRVFRFVVRPMVHHFVGHAQNASWQCGWWHQFGWNASASWCKCDESSVSARWTART